MKLIPGKLFKLKRHLSLIDPLVTFNIDVISRFNIHVDNGDIILLLKCELHPPLFKFVFLTNENRIGYQILCQHVIEDYMVEL